MFSFKRLWMVLPLAGLLASCSEDINVAAPYKPVTVVYGLLDIADTAHYIRIQKAYLDENRSALDLAKNPDSSFFANLDVRLQDYNYTAPTETDLFLPQANFVGEETLTRVNLNDEGYAKENGPFFNTPNYAYKSKRLLTPGHTYRLIVNNPATGQSDTAQTRIINNSPSEFQVYEFTQILQINFAAFRNEDMFKITLRPPANAAMYDGIVRFHYVDKEGSVQTDRTVDYKFASSARLAAPNTVELTTTQRSFYGFLKNTIGPAGTNTQRFMDSCDVIVWAGGKNMYDYLTINNAQGGINADQIKPLYTNIRSNRGKGHAYGLFSTRTSMVRNRAPINDRTMDSLMNSPSLRELNIRGRSDH